MKVAINGFGRIGRIVFSLLEEVDNVEVVAINDLTSAKELAYLLKYDSVHRKNSYVVSYDEDYLLINNKKIKVFNEANIDALPWKELEVDYVLECTGKFTKEDLALKHIEAGARKVIVSAPCKGDVKTIVYNVNENILDGTEKVISAASCTTNCLAPVLKVLDDNFKVLRGFMTTVHAYTNDQVILDVSHKKGIESRRGRAAALNIIPTETGAASAIGKVLPSLDGKLSGSAMRVPVSDGSVIDLTLELDKKVTKEEINNVFKESINETLNYTEDPIVSSDVIGCSCGALVDGLLTNVLETDDKRLVKVVAWYDNEFGYSSQMVRLISYMSDNNM
ncbi:MAG: type I glyceraldehyde-3-phosphate dehydrogenase [Tenericutes bacterium]|nr:type I glyceraldehyde-3-phosphate dehydrogenase [Mycoplasmatota bacterium]